MALPGRPSPFFSKRRHQEVLLSSGALLLSFLGLKMSHPFELPAAIAESLPSHESPVNRTRLFCRLRRDTRSL